MLILFDNNVPKGLRRLLNGHFVRTAHERGWATLKNGMLLEAAERAGFDLFVTADQNLIYQQNLEHRVVSLVVLGSAQWPLIELYLDEVVAVVEAATRNSYAFIAMSLPPKPPHVAS